MVMTIKKKNCERTFAYLLQKTHLHLYETESHVLCLLKMVIAVIEPNEQFTGIYLHFTSRTYLPQKNISINQSFVHFC